MVVRARRRVGEQGLQNVSVLVCVPVRVGGLGLVFGLGLGLGLAAHRHIRVTKLPQRPQILPPPHA